MTAMTITPWQVSSPTGHRIEGETLTPQHQPVPSRAVVLVHGLTGSRHEHIHQFAAGFLIERGYTVLRFNLQNQNFPLRHCTIQTHATDLSAVLAGQAVGYDQLFVVGHSYGGPTVMAAQPVQATAICLWDPSFDLPLLWENMIVEPLAGGIGLMNMGGVEIVIGDAMIAEGHGAEFNAAACLSLSRSLNRPIKVISASSGDEFDVYQRHSQSWHSAGHSLNRRVLIEGSDHCFTSPDAAAALLTHTHDWFARF